MSPVMVLAGDEDFELYRKLAKLKDSLLDPAWASFNYLRIESPSVTDVLDNALSVPFGPGNKVIVFDKCGFFTRSSAGKGKDKDAGGATQKQLDGLDSSLESVAPNTYLIFACPFNFDVNLKLSKVVAKHAEMLPFTKEKFYVGSGSPKYETWIRKEAKFLGATIDDDAVTYLLDGTEANLRQIHQELEKAAVYILPKTHITYAVVEELSPHHSHIFTLLDHWLEGRAAKALDSAAELLSREPAIKVLATMQTFLQKWIELKCACDQATAKLPWGPGVQKRELPYPELLRKVSADMNIKPFLIDRDMKKIKNHSSEYLIRKRHQLAHYEQLVKTGYLHDKYAIELFLAS
ncbi:MAG: DNA polymerase III subunit delta [Candidatus Melainabacteria bacterium]|nr:DNA polymerase III subunit delta [Candidatus Melainabacteria bacterium]